MHTALDLLWRALEKYKFGSFTRSWHVYSSNVNKNIITRMHCPLYMQVFIIANISLRHDVATVNHPINPWIKMRKDSVYL